MIWRVYGKRRGGNELYLGTVESNNYDDAWNKASIGFPYYIITNLEEV